MTLHQRLCLLKKDIQAFENWQSLYAHRLGLQRGKLVSCKIRRGPVFKARLRTSDLAILREVWVEGVYSPLVNAISSDSVVLDLGAHIGSFALYAASRGPNVRVYCYEPTPESYRLLELNVAANHLQDRVHTFNRAVASAAGKKRLYVSEYRTGASSFFRRFDTYCEVNCVTLAQIIESNGIGTVDFLKIDTEGAEYEIILSTPPEILHRVRTITMEFHTKLGDIRDLQKKLAEEDFRVQVYGHANDSLGLLYADARF